jgi:uncharacterized protein (DUF1919 family)
MAILPLEHPHARAVYDEETRIAYITYSGFLNAEASTAVYNWLADVNTQFGTPYGEVFDFRAVTEFAPDNLMEARKKSRRRNLRPEIHNLPVAMVVKDYYQEEILRGPMQNVPENQRKTIVRTIEEAVQFLHEWHERQNKPD